MFDFNKITEAEEKATLVKFKEFGVGVNMSKFAAKIDDLSSQAKYAELVDSELYSENSIKNKMLELAAKINTTCNDELLGDMSVAFSVKTTLGKRVKFTFVEMYTFLRAILKERRNSKEYLAAKKEATALKTLVEQNKSIEDKVKDANEKLAVIAAKFGAEAFEDEGEN